MTDLIPTGREYSRFYAPAIYQALLDEKTVVIPQHTEQDPNDPVNAFFAFLAGEGHRWSAMLDLLAVNSFIPGVTRRSAMVALTRLLGQRLSRPTPATVDIVAEIIGSPGVTDAIVPSGAFVTTDADAVNDSIRYEHVGDDVLADTETFRLVGSDAGVLSAVTLGSITAWAGATGEVNDAIYFGHPTRMFNGLRMEGDQGSGLGVAFEKSDDQFTQLTPDSVVVSGAGLEFVLDKAFGYVNPFVGDHNGLQVVVINKENNDRETVTALFGGGSNKATTTTTLGQVTPSLNPSDYVVVADFLPIPTDTIDFIVSGPAELEFTFPLPETATTRWSKIAVSGLTAHWLRLRVTSVAGPVAPTGVTNVTIEDFLFFVRTTFTQGETIDGETLGVTNGEAFQALSLARSTDFIENSLGALLVGVDPDWSLILNILEADSDDKVFELVERNDGTLFIRFGDGINGRIPPASENVSLTYRADAESDGNVGPELVNNGGAGTEFLSAINNPRPASGWNPREADESDTSGLSFVRARRDVPARVRSSGVIHTAEDAATEVVKRFITADGRRPIARAIAREFGFGWRTSKLICIGAGGAIPTQPDIAELDTFLNGVEAGIQRFGGEAPGGKRIRPIVYVKRVITLNATIQVLKRFEGAAEAIARNALIADLRPLALDTDGNFLWETGQEITADRVKAIFSAAVSGYFSSSFAVFSGITLADTELPELDVAALIVTIQGVIT